MMGEISQDLDKERVFLLRTCREIFLMPTKSAFAIAKADKGFCLFKEKCKRMMDE